MTTRPTVIRAMIATTPWVVVTGLIAIETLTRLLGLDHCVGAALDRQIALAILQLTLLQLLLLLLLALLLLKLLLTLLLLLLLITLALLLLALLIGPLLLILLDLALLVELFLLALLLILLLLLLTLLLIALLILIEAALLVLLLLALQFEATLLLLALLIVLLLLLLLSIVIVGQHLSTDAQGQKTDTCHTPDARSHAFLTAARIPVDRTAFRMRRSPHSISEGHVAKPSWPPSFKPCYRSARGLRKCAKKIAGTKKEGPLALSRILRPGSTLLTPAHLASSSGHCVARWPGQPCRAGDRGWPDSAGRAGRYVRAVILVKRIGSGARHRIANIADENTTCAIFPFG